MTGGKTIIKSMILMQIRRISLTVLLVASMVILSCCGNNDSGINKTSGQEKGENNWEPVLYKCISLVQKSDLTFYKRGKKTDGKDISREMEKNLKMILRFKSLPEPFGRNFAILLAMVTTYGGYSMDGITGPRTPFEVEVNGQRIRVYDWLKKELNLNKLPGEEEGHEILISLYDAVVTPDLLRKWEEYFDRCIDVTRRSKDCKFYLGGKYMTAEEAANIFLGNKEYALKVLINPDIKHPDEVELYDSHKIIGTLVHVRIKDRSEYKNDYEYQKELDRIIKEGWKARVECNDYKEHIIDWIIKNAGAPPPMPKLIKKSKRN